MKILNFVCINKEKAIPQYVDLIIKVFEENPETSFPGELGIECQLRTSKGGGKTNFTCLRMGERCPKFQRFCGRQQ